MSKSIYANETTVPIYKSQEEIRRILSKYGGTSFAFAESKGKAMIMFELKNRRVMFKLPLPPPPPPNSTQAFIKRYEQLGRSKGRALVLGIKAKLECVNSEITTLEQEFMAHIVLPNGSTVGDVVLPEIERSYKSGDMPGLLGMGS